MISQPLLLVVALLYVAFLVMVAWVAESRKDQSSSFHPLIYSLTLAVYCSSWTFFGAVGTAAESAWAYVPIYLGPILLFVLGQPLLRKLILVGSRQKTTSIADFIGTRYGKRQSLAAVVTLVAVVGSLPYIALQLKAISMAWSTLSVGSEGANQVADYQIDTPLVIAMVLALFAMFFGTRHIEGRERNRGMMAAVAVESVVKLVALLVIAGVALWVLSGASAAGVSPQLSESELWQGNPLNSRFLAVTLISFLAIICLPRQFHVAVVEFQDERDLGLARWFFPLYLVLVIFAVFPITLAGQYLFSGQGIAPDTYVLRLPMSLDMENISLIAFLGGFSAATGMVIVAVITLSIMVSNEVILPLLLRWGETHNLQQAFHFGRYLKWLRRSCVVCLLLAGWWVNSNFGNRGLASIGLISFACFAQLAPALIGAIYWRKGHAYGVFAGLAVGFGGWCFFLFLPAIGAFSHETMSNGLWGLSWLRPQALFGFSLGDQLSHGIFWSLAPNMALYVLVSRWAKHSVQDRFQAESYVQRALDQSDRQKDVFELSAIQVGRLRLLLDSFVSPQRQSDLWRYCENRYQQRLMDGDKAPLFVVKAVQDLLSGLIGASSAQRAVKLLESAEPLGFSHIAEFVGGASAQLQFNKDLLQVTVETMSQGISVVDADLKVVAWNKRYEELFDYPPRLLYVGCPIAKVYEYNARRGMYREEDSIAQQVEKRLDLLRRGGQHQFERLLPNGLTVQVVGKPMPNGGFVSTYTDVTEFKGLLARLEQARATLETRVQERTRELEKANATLARENRLRARAEEAIRELHASKTRFMQATSHDLLQPISAAKLFVSALAQNKSGLSDPEEIARQLSHVDKSLDMAENLISSLREIARLEGGKVIPKKESFSAASLMKELETEFALLASRKKLAFHCVASSVIIESDRFLLRRVLQNFLSNAIHYTRRGTILLGARRTAAGLRIEVWDTGPGLTKASQEKIFNEFERLNPGSTSSDRGLGLGLSIAQSIATLLGHKISVRSVPGAGSVFSVTVEYGQGENIRITAAEPEPTAPSLKGVRVVCIDNEPEILAGFSSLLSGWGCEVSSAADWEAFTEVLQDRLPDLLLMDYHLDENMDGVTLRESLPGKWRQLPTIIITADNSDEVRDRVEQAGCAYLSKPVDTAELAAIMEKMLSCDHP